jgi:hypothetical protein
MTMLIAMVASLQVPVGACCMICRNTSFDARPRERSRSPHASPRMATQRTNLQTPQVGHRAVFENAVRRTGGHADAGAHLPNIKMKPGWESHEVLIMPSPEGFKQEFVSNTEQMEGAGHGRGGGEHGLGSVVVMNIHFQVKTLNTSLRLDHMCSMHMLLKISVLLNACCIKLWRCLGL